MDFAAFLQETPFVLAEGSIYERLRRSTAVAYDPHIAHASLLYDPIAADILAQVHREYLDIGQRHCLPMIAQTDTWRAGPERLDRSPFRGKTVNQDHARFLSAIRDGYGPDAAPIFIAGLMACRGDAYRPEEALQKDAATSFHASQVQALAEADVDFLMAATLPAFSEAHGIATVMAETDRPYTLSFVLRSSGTLLDGTPLQRAIDTIDASVIRPPVGYFVNCIHPSVLHNALTADATAGRALTSRLIGFQANTSARSPEELDGRVELDTEAPAPFADWMVQIHRRFGIPIIGGCCGTDTRHIEAIAHAYRATMP